MRRASLSGFTAVLVACVGCDQASKQVAGRWLASASRFALAGDTVRFELASNPGAFLSLGADLPEPARHALLLALAPILLALICLYSWRTVGASRGELVALGLVAGGGLGNWLDRVLHGGEVTDFVSVGVGRFRSGIFNLADVAVLAGIFLLLSLVRRRARAARGES